MTIPAVFKFINWITGTPVPIDDAIVSALTFPVDADLAAILKIKLTEDTIFYVRPGGSDSVIGPFNIDDDAHAFLTLQGAADFILDYVDKGGYSATIQASGGYTTGANTFTQGLNMYGPSTGRGRTLPTRLGVDCVKIRGNTTTPANCLISTTNESCFDLKRHIIVDIDGFKLQTATFGHGVHASSGAIAILGANMDYGACLGYHFTADSALFSVNCNYAISGGATGHWHLNDNAMMETTNGTITLSNTPAFTDAFLSVEHGAVWNGDSPMTFAGTGATGKRFNLTAGGVINTSNSGSVFLPGNAAGTFSIGGGIYDNAIGLTQSSLFATAIAGAIEHGTEAWYATTITAQRQLINAEYFGCLAANYTLTDNATAQKAFNFSTNGALTIDGGITYDFEMEYFISNAGTTSHNWSILFAGTATIGAINYSVVSRTSPTGSAPSAATIWVGRGSSAAALVVTATATVEAAQILVRGVIRTSVGGTLIPQVKMDVAAAGAETMVAGSFIRLLAKGSDTVTNVGAWS